MICIMVASCSGPGTHPQKTAETLQALWVAEGEAPGDAFGTRAMTAGDVNGDGFSDLIVGAPHWDHGRGKVYVYLGGPKGLSAKAAWTASGEKADDRFGDRVGQAGDVNGDGIGDIFIASPGWHGALGRCSVYYGSKRGLGAKQDWSTSPSVMSEDFGDCTHPTGDLDGDGIDDLAVGAFGHDHTRGRIWLFKGSKQGLGAKPIWEAKGEAEGDWYGYGIGAAGDVNGDGVGDLLAGAKYNDQSAHDAGKAYLYLGRKGAGLGQADWTYKGRRAEANASVRVATAGDVNGDGFSDVLVTAPGVDGKLGELYLFYGSAKGLHAQPDLVIEGAKRGLEFFGQGACPAGDVDGDGFDDIAVHGRDDKGRGQVLVYRGSAQGLEREPQWLIPGPGMADRFGWWIAPAGDLDGDGLADLAISAESQGNGAVYVVYGRQFRATEPELQGKASQPSRQLGYLKKR